MKKALIVGINYYEHITKLNGCVNDATSVRSVLERNEDEHNSLNFSIKLKVATDGNNLIDRRMLKDAIIELFADDSEIALLYFAGHGDVEHSGGYLVTSECTRGDDGLSLNDLLQFANQSEARNKIIILDCCHSGYMGKLSTMDEMTKLNEGVTIITASSETQYALEKNGSGVFTNLLVDALSGSASNLLGEITPASVYAHIDNSLGPWEQRPLFKSNVKKFISLRKVKPPISLIELKEIVNLFPEKEYHYTLDPSYEPTHESCSNDNVKTFKLLQKYNRVYLVVPVEEKHMYFAAINSKSCKLTYLGKYYWDLISKGRI